MEKVILVNLSEVRKVFKYGEEVFGTKEEFYKWLIHPNHVGASVLDTLLTDNGLKFLQEELERIARGYCI